MRERELKLGGNLCAVVLIWSLPMRERELKPLGPEVSLGRDLSLPMRERELKPHYRRHAIGVTACRSPCGSVN